MGFEKLINPEKATIYGTPMPLPDGVPQVSNAYLADLMTRQITLLEEQNRILTKQHSDWVDPDGAATMLGKLPNESGTHTRVLKHFIDKGWLKTFGQLRPRTFLRTEVEFCLNKIRNGYPAP